MVDDSYTNCSRRLPGALGALAITAAAALASAPAAGAGASTCDDRSSAGIGYKVCLQIIGEGLRVDSVQVKASASWLSDPRDVNYRIVQTNTSGGVRRFPASNWKTIPMSDSWVANCPGRAGESPCGNYPSSGYTLKAEWEVIEPGFWERNLRDTSGETDELLIK